jgi:hypothetical protein
MTQVRAENGMSTTSGADVISLIQHSQGIVPPAEYRSIGSVLGKMYHRQLRQLLVREV